MSNTNQTNNQTRKPVRSGGPGGGPGGMIRMGQKSKDFKGTMKKLFSYLSPYKIHIFLVFIFAIGSTILSIVGPKVLGRITTSLYTSVSTQSKVDFDYISETIMILLLLYFISSFASYLQSYIMSGVTQKVSYKLRKDATSKINKLPLSYFDKKTYGEILSVMTNDIDSVSTNLNQSMTQIISSITMLLGIFIMMLSISWKLSLIIFFILPTFMFLLMTIIKKSQKFFIAQSRQLAKLNGHIEETYSGHQIVKAYNAEERVTEKFNNYNDELFNTAWKSQFISSILMPIIGFIGNMCYVGVSIYGGYLIVHGELVIGDFQAFIQYVRSFFQPLTQTASSANVIQAMAASAERVFEFLEEKNDVADPATPKAIENIKGKVDFNNVKFGYNPEKIIINDFTCHIEPGQRVAIVGPTGAGKTTIVKLLMRFYDINSGSILLDGTNIYDFTKHDLRTAFGMVLQDTWLFNGTIKENIRYGNLSATDEEVYHAARLAHVEDFVLTLPKGYDLILNEEASNISQGQKQLITIARALLANPKVLILDEATSNVDTRTEIIIQNAMENLMSGRTNFIIAHRLSTIKNADLILVMNKGDIVETGKHQELLDKNGFYAGLYNSQFEEKD